MLLVLGGCGGGEAPYGAAAIDAGDTAMPTVADTPTRARGADGRYISWREHLIDDEQLGGVAIRGGDGLKMADLDGDGHLDVVSVHDDSGHIRLAFGSEDLDRWHLVTLADGYEARAAGDIAIADLDGDGRLDIVLQETSELDVWLEQVRSVEPLPAFKPARDRESRHLPLPAADRGENGDVGDGP